MKAFSFIHAADLHLGCPFQGITAVNEAVGQALRQATYQAFDRIVDCAIAEKVDFVVFAGDIYNSGENNLQPQLHFRDGMARLHEANIASSVIHGNHDPLEDDGLGPALPDSCHRFPSTASEPHLILRDGEPLAVIAGISFGKRWVAENLALQYRHAHPHLFSIAVLHTNCGGIAGYSNYAPCTLEDLRGSYFDYWALGHIHQPAVLQAARPTVIYAGSPQGLNRKEAGQHGCYHVAVDVDRRVSPRLVRTAPVVWHHERVDPGAWVSQPAAITALEHRVAELRTRYDQQSVLLRLTLEGPTELHGWLQNPLTVSDLLTHLRGQSGTQPFVWVEDLNVQTQPNLDLDQVAKAQDLLGEILRQAPQWGAPEPALSAARQQLAPLFDGPMRNLLEPLTDDQLRQSLNQAAALAVYQVDGDTDC